MLGVPLTTTSSVFFKARGRSCGLFSPSRCPLIISSGCTVLGEVVGGGRLYITSLQNHFKSRRPDSLLYLDQSAMQVIDVIRRYRQRPRRVLLLRAIESLAVVASYHPDYLLLVRLEFKQHKCPYPCLTHPYHFFILLRVLSIFFGNIVFGLLYEAVVDRIDRSF